MDQSNKKIKVCHLSSAHPPGDIRIFHKECTSLASSGDFEVSLITVNSEEKIQNGVQLLSAKTNSSNRFFRMLNASKAVYKKALEVNADVYHFHDPELLPYGLKLQKKGKKVIYDAHEDVPRQILGKPWIPKILRKPIAYFYEKYEDYISSRLSFVVVSTPTIKKRYLKVTPNTEAICNYPILGENTHLPDWDSRANEICYIGGITRIRGAVEIVKTLELLPDVKLNMAGPYSSDSLKQELQVMPAWNRVKDYGFVSRQEIVGILNRSKVGLVTLYPQENYLDSLPIKMFEYMYAGIPVVASNFPLWKQIVTDHNCGICVNPLDVGDISTAVSKLLTDDHLAKQMGENGRKAVLDFYNWENEERKLINIYHQLFK